MGKFYSTLPYDGFSPYCLDNQLPAREWAPRWGVSVIHADLDHSYAVDSRVTEDGVLIDVLVFDEDGEDETPHVFTLLAPYEYDFPPALNYVGCEVDGTFFLLYNYIPEHSQTATA